MMNGNTVATVKHNYLELFAIYVFPFLSYNCYYYVGADLPFWKLVYFLCVPLMTFYVGKDLLLRRVDKVFSLVRWLLISMVGSIFMAWMFWDQSVGMGYRVTAPFFVIIYFFILHKSRATTADIRKLVYLYSAIWILLFLYALSQVPQVVFDWGVNGDELRDDRGFFRIYIPGSNVIVVLFFMALNDWRTRRKPFYLAIASIAFTFIVLQVTRQTIVFSLVVALYYLIRKVKYSLVYTFFAFLIFSNVKFTLGGDSIIGRLIELSETQYNNTKTGDRDTRILEYEYFFTKFPQNAITVLLGNGMPHMDSDYGHKEELVRRNYGFFRSDVGYPSTYVTMGAFGLLILFLIFWYSLRQKVPEDLIFIKMFLWFMLLTNITTWTIFDIYFVAMLYVIYTVGQTNERDRRQ